MKWPRNVLLVLVTLIPFYYWRFSILGFPTNPIEMGILGLTVAILVTGQGKKTGYPFWASAILIIAGISIGVFVSTDQRAALGILKGWFVVPIMLSWVVYQVSDKELFARLPKMLLINVLLVSLYAILQWLNVIPLLSHQSAELNQYINQGRALGFFESPNYLAMYLVPLTLFVGVSLYYSNQKRLLPFLIAPLVVIFLTASRAGEVALVGSLFMLGYWIKPNYHRVLFVILGIVAIVGLFIWSSHHGQSDTIRLVIWEGALKLVRTHPIFGVGPGQFRSQLSLLHQGEPAYWQFVHPYALHPHNIFLSYWLSGGLLALVGFLLLLGQLFRQAIQAKSTWLTLAAITAVSSVILQGLFDSTYLKNDLAMFFWLFCIIFWVGRIEAGPYNEISNGQP